MLWPMARSKKPPRKKPPRKKPPRTSGSEDAPFRRVHEIVRAIPRGRVTTYGQISRKLDGRISALAVGWALNQCPDDVPWHRVVNAKGGCSTDRRPDVPPGAQKFRLEDEGVRFRSDGTVDLDCYGVDDD